MTEIRINNTLYILETTTDYIRVHNCEEQEIAEVTWETLHRYYKGKPSNFLGKVIGWDIAYGR